MWEEREGDARRRGYLLPVGVDEAGRGPLAGPVVAAACFLPAGFFLEGIADSKLLTPKNRERLSKKLRNAPGVFFGIGIVTPLEIDEINILQASLLAMLRGVEALEIKPDILFIDGNRVPKTTISATAVVKGDQKVQSIAAASIIAKVERDSIMDQYDEIYPEYGFAKHKGYPTKEHRKAIEKYGPCPIHRMTFSLLSLQKG